MRDWLLIIGVVLIVIIVISVLAGTEEDKDADR